MSDHRYLLLSVECIIGDICVKNKNYTKSILHYEKVEKHFLWDEILVSDSFNELIGKCLVIINDCKEEITCNNNGGKQPWVNRELINLIRIRNKTYKLTQKFPNNNFIRNKYCDLKKQAKKLNCKLKKNILTIN